MSKLKRLIFSILEYASMFVVFAWLLMPGHEWLHLQVLHMLGGSGHIILTWYGAACVIEQPPIVQVFPSAEFWVALAGGVGMFFLYLWWFLWDWPDDVEEASATIPFMLKSLAYGIFEGFFISVLPPSEFLKWGTIVCVASVTVGIILSLYVWVKYCLLKVLG